MNLEVIVEESMKCIDGVTELDVKYLILRPKFGSLFDPSNRASNEQVEKTLSLFTDFLF